MSNAGKLHRGATEYYVTCYQCGEQFVNHLYSQKAFVRSLRESGWRIRGGVWHCPLHTTKVQQGG